MRASPAPLAHSSGSVLEFEALRTLLAAYFSSELGRRKLSTLAPTADLPWIRLQHSLTSEVRHFRSAGGSFDFSGLADPASHLELSTIEGAALEIDALRQVLVLVERAEQWREIVLHPPSHMPEWPAVAALSAGIADFKPLLRFFANKILPDGTLDDRASPELARLRREIEKQKRSIQDSLRAYVRRLAEGGAAQDDLITIRGERFVIPVKTEQKRRISGVVHGASSSGQTVFIEPLETIEQNNELVRLLEEELAEVHRILLEMTRHIGERAAEVAIAAEVLEELELQFAEARFAEDYQCVEPAFLAQPPPTDGENEDKSPANPAASTFVFLMDSARHPLLERHLRARGSKSKIVPITVELGHDARQLIISGPNTGGKTVALKTIGLLTLMAQAGIPLPAERAHLPVFDAVLADIGDYQSIEQDLSTFSAHLTRIDFISRAATANSLVLLDELGSATDPIEGAALAVAIAAYFLRDPRQSPITVISTHHTSLKVYASNTPGVVNAAVGFDEQTLQPTYELRLGVPGASAGINIAQRLGLNPSIIQSARAKLGSQTQDIARFLDKLHAELRAAGEQRIELRQRELQLEKEQARLAREGMHEQRLRVKELEKKLEALLKDFDYRARETVNAVQERAAALKLSKDAERRIARMRREFKEEFDSTVVAHSTGADVGDPNASPGLVTHVSAGDRVRLKSLGKNTVAVVRRHLDQDTFEVELGAGKMTMKIPRADIAEVLPAAKTASPPVAANPVQAARARGVSVKMADETSATATEINVIGENVDEATSRVEKFVDRAFLAGLPRVRIVHGSGMGILRKALRQYLEQHPHVASVIEPPQNEGGAGATVVELKL
jgi:DNA mismatch repair protein MutS2